MNLPIKCEVNKIIPKKIFYEKLNISLSLKQEFIHKLERIYWKYKISEDTINITKTIDIEEIEIFELTLKEKCDIKNIINIITKKIPYIILFIIIYNDEFQYAIKFKEDILLTDWNEEKEFNFVGINLKEVNNNIIRKFINDEPNTNIEEIIENNKQVEELKKKINILKNKINREVQFNRKVELNIELINLEKELEEFYKNDK